MAGKVVKLEISKIGTRERSRLRPLDRDKVVLMAESMKGRGLLHPVTVYPAANEGKGAKTHVLAAGLHRLAAAEKNGDTTIDAKIVTKEEAAEIEVEENLCRAELSALDRALHINRRRQLFTEKHGEPTRGGDQKAKTALWSDAVTEIADRVGLSERTLKMADKIGRDLTPELMAEVRKTEAADNQSQLYKLAGMEPAQQRKIATAVGKGVAIGEAISAASGAAATSKKDDAQKRISAVLSNFAALSARDRKAVFQQLFNDFPNDCDWALENPIAEAE